MSKDESSLPESPGTVSVPDQDRSPYTPEPGRSTLRSQVAEVIRHVLDDTDPDGEWARTQLSESLAAHAGHPERALLEHLILTRSLAGAAEDATARHPGEGSAEAVAASGTDAPSSLDAGRIHRIENVLENRMVLTALQPVRQLPTGRILGFEALTRFVSTDGSPAATWFRDAAALGLGADLEIAALESAIAAGQEIPAPLFIAVNLSPAAITDPRIQYLLLTSSLPPDRIIIDLTEQAGGQDWAAVAGTLEPLRRHGLRFSMDGSDDDALIVCVRSIRPEIIKLDRGFISSLVDGQNRSVAAVRGLARETGGVLAAEGIETQAELAAVIEAGVTAGQGFLLGRPSANPDDWASWTAQMDNPHDIWSALRPRRGR